MSNQFYDKGLDRFATGGINWIEHNIYASLIYSNGYSVDIASDEFYGDILSSAIASSVFIEGRSTNNKGTMDGNDITFPSVPGDGVREATILVIWREIGNNFLLSPLIAYIDGATEFPVVPNGDDIAFTWSNGANKILTLNPT